MPGNLSPFLRELQQFQAAFFLEVNQFRFLHLLQDLHHVRIRAVNVLRQHRGINIAFSIFQLDQHHRRLFPKKDIKDNFIFLGQNFHPLLYRSRKSVLLNSHI